MVGKPKIKLYHYDTVENRCKRLGVHNSYQEARNIYYKGAKYPLFRAKRLPDIHILPDDTLLTREVMYRDLLINKIKLSKDPLYIDGGYIKECPIIVKNMNGQQVAEFESPVIMSKLTGMSPGQIYGLLKINKISVVNNSLYGISIEYKQKEYERNKVQSLG